MFLYFKPFITENYIVSFIIIIVKVFITSLTTQTIYGVRSALSINSIVQPTLKDIHEEVTMADVSLNKPSNYETAQGDFPERT